MNLSKLALAAITAVTAISVSACAVAPDGSDSNGERAAENCGLCIPQTPKIVHSEWSSYQIKIRDTSAGTSTTLPLNGRHPVLNADQSKVAFAGTDGNIYIANASDGSGKIKLTSGGVFDSPAFSPDKTTIVFASVGTAGYGADIYKVVLATGVVTKLTANPGYWFFDPKFLDASTVVFQNGLDGTASFALVPITAVNKSTFTYLQGLPSGDFGDLSVAPGGAHVSLTKQHGSCGAQAVMIGTVSGATVSNLHETFCTAGFNSHGASIGGSNLVAFEWGSYASTEYVYTIPLAGGSATYQGIYGGSDEVDMSMR